MDSNRVEKYQEDLKSVIGDWNGQSVLDAVTVVDLGTNPLASVFDVSEALTPDIHMVWNNTLDYVRNLNKEHGKILQSTDDLCERRQVDYDDVNSDDLEVEELNYEDEEHSERIMEAVQEIQTSIEIAFYAGLFLRFGMSVVVQKPREDEPDGAEIWIDSRGFKAGYYAREYIAFLLEVLQSNSDVGETTNFSKLRSIHISNSPCPVPGKTAWEVFEASMKNRMDRLSFQILSMQRPTTIPNMDFFDIMRRTLGGRLRNVDGIQVSIADRLLGVKEVGKDTFSGRISRRRVQLLRWGEDNALVLPYLNTIILQLNDDRWVRDHGVKALQPCKGIRKYEGWIRRAATVLLAFDYPRIGEPKVNGDAYRLIYQHARKGELYSKNLRNKLLSVKGIVHRVDIRALEERAREVFNDDEVMMASLTREMVHDVLMTKSCFKEESTVTIDGGFKESRTLTQVRCDDDAYYDTFYRKCSLGTRNNIECITGVPLLGLRTDYSLKRAGQLDGKEMHGVAIERRYDGEQVVVWIPARKSREYDNEVATGFIENRECVDGKVIEALSTAVPNNGPTFDNFRLGGYCRFNFDVEALENEKRDNEIPFYRREGFIEQLLQGASSSEDET